MSFRKHDSVPSLVIGEIKRSGRPCTTLELARAVGMNTRKEINPTLYEMERQGALKKVQDQPPLWQVAQGGPMQGMGVNTGAHGRQQRKGERAWSGRLRPLQICFWSLALHDIIFNTLEISILNSQSRPQRRKGSGTH